MTLMEYLIKTGSERVSQQCKENMYAVQTLKDFQYVDRDGKDQGVNVREKAKQLVALLRDEDRLREERAHALKTKEKLAQTATDSGCWEVTSTEENGGNSASSVGRPGSVPRNISSSVDGCGFGPCREVLSMVVGQRLVQLPMAYSEAGRMSARLFLLSRESGGPSAEVCETG
ncbi:hypothetical protein P7K49_035120 [Saguinus oedipus]|uniref:ENTH domain-containing protein n=1 Tax=Saguinus oedipus TaxID=9490 RepID=A0ABQ9TXS1_SAGOE|nr:hypothetical protein P7K49_035120 [Saguinus oedipus]